MTPPAATMPPRYLSRTNSPFSRVVPPSPRHRATAPLLRPFSLFRSLFSCGQGDRMIRRLCCLQNGSPSITVSSISSTKKKSLVLLGAPQVSAIVLDTLLLLHILSLRLRLL